MLMQSLLIHIFPVIAYAWTALSRAQCGETEKRICYGLDGGDSQHVNLADVKYVAEYLRYIARSNEGAARFWNMPETAGNCPEWTLPVPDGGTVLALAKHVSPEIRSSILYEDLASAIDGGLWATPEEQKESLYGCGTNGGQVGVVADLRNPLYHTTEYKKSGAKPEGIVIKIVQAPPEEL